ncbi:MAG: hypothetical protein IJ057_03345 [Bacteroidales bacterium]|nr:hypothetical protein [Bacteroidales bacterium]
MDKTTRTTKDYIEDVVCKTFEAIQDAYNYQQEKAPKLDNPSRIKLSRIVFPKKRRGETTRISEQELRCVFVEQLNKKIAEGWDVYYSFETPTQDAYSGFSNGGAIEDALVNLTLSSSTTTCKGLPSLSSRPTMLRKTTI